MIQNLDFKTKVFGPKGSYLSCISGRPDLVVSARRSADETRRDEMSQRVSPSVVSILRERARRLFQEAATCSRPAAACSIFPGPVTVAGRCLHLHCATVRMRCSRFSNLLQAYRLLLMRQSVGTALLTPGYPYRRTIA